MLLLVIVAFFCGSAGLVVGSPSHLREWLKRKAERSFGDAKTDKMSYLYVQDSCASRAARRALVQRRTNARFRF